MPRAATPRMDACARDCRPGYALLASAEYLARKGTFHQHGVQNRSIRGVLKAVKNSKYISSSVVGVKHLQKAENGPIIHNHGVGIIQSWGAPQQHGSASTETPGDSVSMSPD
ncbi:hypothetical protein B0H13DRAFT_1875233 [Mycena leptocephala]|nr:hypothetical protein B0H13DRAFT_1875233 [Mycena leptocephala]